MAEEPDRRRWRVPSPPSPLLLRGRPPSAPRPLGRRSGAGARGVSAWLAAVSPTDSPSRFWSANDVRRTEVGPPRRARERRARSRRRSASMDAERSGPTMAIHTTAPPTTAPSSAAVSSSRPPQTALVDVLPLSVEHSTENTATTPANKKPCSCPQSPMSSAPSGPRCLRSAVSAATHTLSHAGRTFAKGPELTIAGPSNEAALRCSCDNCELLLGRAVAEDDPPSLWPEPLLGGADTKSPPSAAAAAASSASSRAAACRRRRRARRCLLRSPALAAAASAASRSSEVSTLL